MHLYDPTRYPPAVQEHAVAKERWHKRQAQLDVAVTAIQHRYGPRVLARGDASRVAGSAASVPHVPTGFPVLDRALGIGAAYADLGDLACGPASAAELLREVGSRIRRELGQALSAVSESISMLFRIVPVPS
jgi:hypothetical protein